MRTHAAPTIVSTQHSLRQRFGFSWLHMLLGGMRMSCQAPWRPWRMCLATVGSASGVLAYSAPTISNAGPPTVLSPAWQPIQPLSRASAVVAAAWVLDAAKATVVKPTLPADRRLTLVRPATPSALRSTRPSCWTRRCRGSARSRAHLRISKLSNRIVRGSTASRSPRRSVPRCSFLHSATLPRQRGLGEGDFGQDVRCTGRPDEGLGVGVVLGAQ